MLIPPPVIAAAWLGVQAALTAQAGGRRRFPGQLVGAGALVAGAVALAGAAITRFRAVSTTRRPMDPTETTSLVTDGVYTRSRNPMYLATLVVMLAGTAVTGRLRTLVAVPGMMLNLEPQLRAEERALAEKFGTDYADYSSRVRRWL